MPHEPTCIVWANLTPFPLQCTAVVRDAMEPLCDGALAGLLTCFGLQQLPDPVAAVTAWCDVAPGGKVIAAPP